MNQCGVCENECEINSCTLCSKKVCRECINTYSTLKKKFLFPCCNQTIPWNDIHSFFSKHEIQSILYIMYPPRLTHNSSLIKQKLNSKKSKLQQSTSTLQQSKCLRECIAWERVHKIAEKTPNFLQKCTIVNCNYGYIIDNQCIQCNSLFCSSCQQSVDENHRCISNFKRCPNCQVGIEKTEGCNTMWCTMCHHMFHWETLEAVSPDEHNPHAECYKKQTPGFMLYMNKGLCVANPQHKNYNDIQFCSEKQYKTTLYRRFKYNSLMDSIRTSQYELVNGTHDENEYNNKLNDLSIERGLKIHHTFYVLCQ